MDKICRKLCKMAKKWKLGWGDPVNCAYRMRFFASKMSKIFLKGGFVPSARNLYAIEINFLFFLIFFHTLLASLNTAAGHGTDRYSEGSLFGTVCRGRAFKFPLCTHMRDQRFSEYTFNKNSPFLGKKTHKLQEFSGVLPPKGPLSRNLFEVKNGLFSWKHVLFYP